jgi:hypothetical protein
MPMINRARNTELAGSGSAARFNRLHRLSVVVNIDGGFAGILMVDRARQRSTRQVHVPT